MGLCFIYPIHYGNAANVIWLRKQHDAQNHLSWKKTIICKMAKTQTLISYQEKCKLPKEVGQCSITRPLLAPFTILLCTPCSFQFVANRSCLTFSLASFFHFSMVHATFLFSFLLLNFFFCSFLYFHRFYAPFRIFCAPCSRIIIWLLLATFPILRLAPCSFVPNKVCSLLQDYPYRRFKTMQNFIVQDFEHSYKAIYVAHPFDNK